MNKLLFKKVVTTAMVFGIAATAFSTQSFAATADTDATVRAGSLSGGGVTFSSLSTQLDGTKKSATATWGIADVIDARGTGAGWNLSIELEPFKEYDTVAKDYVADGKILATSSLKVKTAPVVGQIDETSSLADTITPVGVGQALDGAGSVKLLSAALNGGMGSFSVGDLGVELTIPANAYAKTYKTEATVTLNEAP
nr:WxL domain-containing protein [Fredinandcohnia onubensis]